jgi:hypothetical protein
MLDKLVIGLLCVLLYGSGFLVWPVFALIWRRSGRRAKALCWTFFAELLGQAALAGFFIFSRDILEHQYYWLMCMIIMNVLFTPVMILSAVYDHAAQAPKTHQP